MARVLIAGCGYLGTATAGLFRHASWHVTAWTRTRESSNSVRDKVNEIHAVDLSSAADVKAASGKFEAVIHSASTGGGDVDAYRRVYLDGARHLLEEFPDARMVFVSSTSVYAQKAGEIVDETNPAEPEHATGKILREAEELVLASGGTVARLGGIYGPGRSALLRKFLRGEAMIDPANDRFVNEIHRDDAASALFQLATAEVPPGIYNVVDDEPILQSSCYRWFARKFDRPEPPTGQASTKRKRGAGNKRVSNAKLRRLGWALQFPTMPQGMEKSVLPNLAQLPL